MALTIAQKPYSLTPLNQKLIFDVTSTNVANPGFRFVFDITIDGDLYRQLIVPNAVNHGILDIREVIKPYIKAQMNQASPNTHRMIGYTQVTAGDIEEVLVTVYEGYDVAGVFEVDDATPSDGVSATTYIWGGTIGPRYGYRPDPQDHYLPGFGPLSRLKSQGIYRWDGTVLNGFEGNFVIPVNTNDYGVISFIVDDGSHWSSAPAQWKIRQSVQQATGVPVTVTETIVMQATPAILIIGAYPGNIADDGGLTWTLLDADFKYVTWELLDGSNNAITSKYVMFNNYHELGEGCKYDRVRVAWANELGGWDYFNFTLRNEIIQEVDRKRFRKPLGDYNATSFSFAIHDRGHTEFDINAESFIECTSDWITEAAYTFLRGLITSKDVYLIDTIIDGVSVQETLAVVLEENTFRERNDKSGKKYNVTMKFKFAIPLLSFEINPL